MNHLWITTLKWLVTIVATTGLLGCPLIRPDTRAADARLTSQIGALLPADAILLGEQHDVPDHQRIERVVVENLASRGLLAKLVLEMATRGHSTESLKPDASESLVRDALGWKDDGWPWASYGPPIMAAVQAGVPVVGANLASAQWRATMSDATLESRLSERALKDQQDNIRKGHCDLLPESQILPMTRIQIARDLSMAQTLMEAAQPGKLVLLLAGRAHVNRELGVPLHLGSPFKAKTILLANHADPATSETNQFDQRWLTEPGPKVDYCAKFAAQRAKSSRPIAPAAPKP